MNKLNPVETYTPPSIPTLANKPALHVLPLRWAKNIAVTACIGVLGATTLAGCVGAINTNGDYTTTTQATTTAAQTYPESTTYAYTTTLQAETTTPTSQNQPRTVEPVAQISGFELSVRSHGGGSGGVPTYVVHFTEQEILNILRNELESAGLRFGDSVPNYTATPWLITPTWRERWDSFRWGGEPWRGFGDPLGLNWFDEQNNVAIALIPFGPGHGEDWPGMGIFTPSRLVGQTQRQFDRQNRRMNFGVFYSPEFSFAWPLELEMFDWANPEDAGWWGGNPRLTTRALEYAEPALRASLDTQIQQFIQELQRTGVL